jgi:mersacidin/lichenicidin family type 2 lantibiotic
MTGDQIIRAWKDPHYRSTLSAAELAQLPANPAGLMELTDEDLDEANGGTGVFCVTVSIRICTVTVRVTRYCHYTFLFLC